MDSINNELVKYNHEKEIVKKLIAHKLQFISNIFSEVDSILKLNSTKISLPKIREAACLDIAGKPYGDWNGFRKRRREAGVFFPMANYNFHDPSGFKIIYDDCEDMIELLKSDRLRFAQVDLVIDLLFTRCDLIAARYSLLRGCVDINANTAPDFLIADFTSAFTSRNGTQGGYQSGLMRRLNAAPIKKAWQAEADKIWKKPKNSKLSKSSVAKLIAKKIGGNVRTIRGSIQKPSL